MLGHDLFVGRYDVLAERDGLQDAVEGRIVTAHDLDYDVDLGIVENVGDVVGQKAPRKLKGAVLGQVSHQGFSQRNRASGQLLEHAALL